MTENKSTVRFAPWVGLNYERGFRELRILLVCESHYASKKHERPTVTPENILWQSANFDDISILP